MKQLALITEIPEPRETTHECGAQAVEGFFFSPRAQAITSVVVCSRCHSSFYPKALKPLAAPAKPARGIAAVVQKASVA